MAQEAALPTYRTAARVLEGQTGSGLALAGWTVARMVMILPPFLVVGVPVRRAAIGAALSSLMISGFTLLRLSGAGPDRPEMMACASRGLGSANRKSRPKRKRKH